MKESGGPTAWDSFVSLGFFSTQQLPDALKVM